MPSGADIIKDCVTEFSRLQDWMIPIKEVAPETYESMHKRYIELKLITYTTYCYQNIFCVKYAKIRSFF